MARKQSERLNICRIFGAAGVGHNWLDFSPDKKFLATIAGSDVKIWDVSSGQLVNELNGSGGAILSIQWSPDGKHIAAGTGMFLVQVWDVSEGKMKYVFQGHNDWVISLAWSPDNKRLASVSDDGVLLIWNVNDSTQHNLSFISDIANAVSWAPDSAILTIGCEGEVIWHDLRKTILTRRFNYKSNGYPEFSDDEDYGNFGPPNIRTFKWSPKGRWLAVVAGNYSIVILGRKGLKVSRILEGHKSQIKSLSWSANENYLLSASNDGAWLWKCKGWGGAEVLPHISGEFDTLGVAFHDDSQIRTSFDDGRIRIETKELSPIAVFSGIPTTDRYASAKVVLIGEANVGKSCLALRLAENRYEEMGTTHGMRTWFCTAPR